MAVLIFCLLIFFVFSSRRRHTICALVTGVQTCALPISLVDALVESVYDVWLENWRASIEVPRNLWDLEQAAKFDHPAAVRKVLDETGEIGRAWSRDRWCQYVFTQVGAVPLTKQKKNELYSSVCIVYQ